MSDLYEVAMMVKEAAEKQAGVPTEWADKPAPKNFGYKMDYAIEDAIDTAKFKGEQAKLFVKNNAKAIARDARAVVQSVRAGKDAGYGVRAAQTFAKAHKGLVGGAGLAAAAGLGALAYSKNETGAAKTAAELMYQEAMAEADEVNEKIAFAQQLFEDAEYEEKIASETSNAVITTRPSTKMETLQAYARNIKHDAADVVESARKGKATGYGLRAAKTFAKAHPGALAAGALAAGALTAGGAYAYNSRAKTAAELIYNEAMADADEINEKIAFAQQLFDEADYAEKLAEDNGSGTAVPYAASAGYGAAAGAAVGGVAGSALMGLNYHLNHVAQDPRAIAVGGAAGAAVGSVIGAAAAPLAQAGIAGVGALKAFVDEHRAQRAAQNVQG